MKKILTILFIGLFCQKFSQADPIPYDDDWNLLKLDNITSSQIKIQNNILKYKSKKIKLNATKGLDVHVLKNNIFIYERDHKVLNIYNLKNNKSSKIDWIYGELQAVMNNCPDLIKKTLFLKLIDTSKSEYFFLTKYPLSERTKKYMTGYALEGGRLSLVYSEKFGFIGDKKGFKGADKVLIDNNLKYIGDVLSIQIFDKCEFSSVHKN